MDFSRLLQSGKAYVLTCFLVLVLLVGASYCKDDAALPQLLIFYSPSCHKCVQIRHEIMPPVEAMLKGVLSFQYLDISDIAYFKRLVSLQQKNAPDLAIKVPLFYLNGRFLGGENMTGETLLKFINEAKDLNYQAFGDQAGVPDFAVRIREIRPLAVIGAGFIDGINPCAFTVILFFLSFLALQGYRKREVAVVGTGFILAVFLTYVLIGLGIFNFFYHLEKFYVIARAFNFGIGIASVIFGVLAAYDIYLFLSTKTTQGLVLQLPKIIKDRIHFVIGRYYRRTKQAEVSPRKAGGLYLASFITGFLVCLLEAVCTGQMYIPTITFIIKSTSYKAQGLGYLLLYNFMFIFPLAVILFLVLAGITSARVGSFFRKYIVTVKVLMAILFFGFGIYLIMGR